MPDQLTSAFSVRNLERCWQWIRTNPEAGYKYYFRDIYNAYQVGIDHHLPALSNKLQTRGYQPSFAVKLFFPKSSGLLRPWSLLSVEDQIAYLAAVSMVAERLHPRIRKNYRKSVFGNLYAGKKSQYFYQNWRSCYREYTDAMRVAYKDGYRWTASFDLTACFDSIDHHVLSTRMANIKVDQDLIEMLLGWLRHWTAHNHNSPMFMEHGIPQGPLASGLLSEVVLSYFDASPRTTDIVYLRYVDDIRLFGPREDAIREQLIELDLTSKQIGLFPQSGKIKIHAVEDIESEMKGVSNPPEDVYDEDEKIDQDLVCARLYELSRRLKIDNETRFKYVLAKAKPNAALTCRLIRLLRNYPHLHGSIGRFIELNDSLSKATSREALVLLREYNLYSAFTASLVRALRGRLHKDYKGAFTRFCKTPFATGRRGPKDPELRAALASVIIGSGAARWSQVEGLATWKDSWWVRAELLRFVRVDLVGPATASSLANRLLRDTHADPACVATEFLLKHGLALEKPYRNVHTNGQHGLRTAKVIGRLRSSEDLIRDFFAEELGKAVRSIGWRKILGPTYKQTIPTVARWKAYAKNDATSWVNITDTIMDITLDKLFEHDDSLGGYSLGKIGCVLNAPTGRFATRYPKLYLAATKIHGRRLESDLSHPRTRMTGRPTSFIRYHVMESLKHFLKDGFVELWSSW